MRGGHPISGSAGSRLEVLGDFRIVGLLGRGGFGEVYRAEQRSLGREVALKVLSASRLASSSARSRFLREASLIAKLTHPGIVPVYQAGEQEGVLYYAMELVDGLPLDAYLSERQPSLRGVLELMIGICDGVQAAHQKGIIHRDLKPANVLVDAEGHARVVDFGLGKIVSEESPDFSVLTEAGGILGTPAYLAPEQASGLNDEVDTRTDVYALGLILYLMLTGRTPYSVRGSLTSVLERIRCADPVPVRRYAPCLPVDLETVVLKALRKEKDARYASAGELGDDLRRFLAGEPVLAHRPTLRYRVGKFVLRNRFAVSAACVFLIAVLCTAGAAFWRINAARRFAERQRGRAEAGELEARRQRDTARLAMARAELARREAERAHAAEQFRTRMLAYRLAAECVVRHDAEGYALLEGLPKTWETGLLLRELRRVCYAPPHLPLKEGTYHSVCFSPSGRYLAVHGNSGSLMWDCENSSILWRASVWTQEGFDATFLDQGAKIAVTTGDKIVFRWALTGDGAGEIQAPDKLYRVAVTPDGSLAVAGCGSFAGGSHTPYAYGWSLPSGREVFRVKLADVTYASGIDALSVSPDGMWAVVACSDLLVLLRLPEGEEIRRFVAGQSGVRALAYSIDGSTLASGGDDQSVRLWSMPEGVPAGRLVGHEAAVWSVAYHPSRALLCSGAQNGEVILWDVETKSPLTHLLAGGDWVTSVEFSPDGRRLAAMSERLSLWDTSLLPDRPSAIIRDTPVELAKVRFQAGSEAKVLYAMIPGRLIRYGVDSEGDLGQVWSNAELGRFTHCFAPDPKGRFVAVGAWEGYVILCDADSGKEVRRWRAADRHILGVAFSLDGRLFASGSIGGEIRVWSVPDFDEVTRLSQRLASCGAVAFDPGGTVFAAAELYSGDLRWWDIASGEPIGHVVTGRGSGNSICFSPSGKWLAMGTANGPVTRRRMPSGESGGVLEGAYGKAVDVTISPDERIIGAACSNGALLLWDATTGERLRFARPLSLTDVLSVDFSSDGRYLGVVRRGGVVELLDSEYPAAPVEDRK